MSDQQQASSGQEKRPPGACIPWEEKRSEMPQITGDEQLVERVWKDVEGLGYMFIWQILLSF